MEAIRVGSSWNSVPFKGGVGVAVLVSMITASWIDQSPVMSITASPAPIGIFAGRSGLSPATSAEPQLRLQDALDNAASSAAKDAKARMCGMQFTHTA